MGLPLTTTRDQPATQGIHYQLLIAGYVLAVILFNRDPALTVIPKFIGPVVGFAFLVLVLGYGRKIHVPMAYRIWAVWFFVAIASTLLADEVRLTRLITLAQLAGIGLIITNFLIWNHGTRFYRIALVAGTVLSSLWILSDPSQFGDPSASGAAGRISGTIGNANAHGMLLSVAMILSLAAALSARRLVFKASMWALVIWFFTMLLQTGSRKAMLGGVIIGGGVVLALYLYQKWVSREGSFALSFGASLLMVPVVFGALASSEYWYRVERALEPGDVGLTADGSVNERVWMMRRAIELWSDHPILGMGIDSFRSAQDADHFFATSVGGYSHSNYFELLVGTGLVGVLLYASIYFLLLSKLFSLRTLLQHSRFFVRYAVVSAMLLLVLIYDFAAVSYYGKLFWLLLPFIVAEVHLMEQERLRYKQKGQPVHVAGGRASGFPDRAG
jgi:O-antigen ligase